jgi:hypothetical protein
MRGDAANGPGFRREFKIAQIPVCRASVRHKDRVIEIKDNRRTRMMYPSFKQGWAKQRCLSKDVNGVVIFNEPH